MIRATKRSRTLFDHYIERVTSENGEYTEPTRRKIPKPVSQSSVSGGPANVPNLPPLETIIPRPPRASLKTKNTNSTEIRSDIPPPSSPPTINPAGTILPININPSTQSDYDDEHESPVASDVESEDGTDATYAPSNTDSASSFDSFYSPTSSRSSSVSPPFTPVTSPQNPESTMDTVTASIFSGVVERNVPLPWVRTPLTPVNPTKRILVPTSSSIDVWDYSSIETLTPEQRKSVRDTIDAYDALSNAVTRSIPATKQLEEAMFDRASGAPDIRRSEYAINLLQRVAARLTAACTRLEEAELQLIKLRGYRLHGLDFALKLDEESLTTPEPQIVSSSRSAPAYPTFRRIDISKIPFLTPTSDAFRRDFIR
ncbi:hypothetical protein TWF281_007952 [Arthrobotrys megalospora]